MKKTLAVIICVVMLSAARSQSTKVYFISKEVTRVAINGSYHYQFAAADSNGQAVAYGVKKLPVWLQYDASNQSISGSPGEPGQFPVELIASAGADTAHQFFMLTVFDPHTTNILCLGNSLTNGVDTFNSYRRDLWQMLTAGHYDFDFIGSWSQHHMGTPVPVPDFDMDHEGHSGWTFEDILRPPSWDSVRGSLHNWVNEYSADMVLIELGTNDVFHCRKPAEMFANLNEIIDLLRRKNKHVRFFLAQIPPLGAHWSDKKLCGNDTTYAQAIKDLNQGIAEYAKANSTGKSPITAVDQFTGVDPSKDMFDDIHPNSKGEKIMAERWFKAMAPYLKKRN